MLRSKQTSVSILFAANIFDGAKVRYFTPFKIGYGLRIIVAMPVVSNFVEAIKLW